MEAENLKLLAGQIRIATGRCALKMNVRRVFDCILERSLDEGRDFCVLPLKFLSAYSGLAKSHAGSALGELVRLGLIKRPKKWIFVPVSPELWRAPDRSDFTRWGELEAKLKDLNLNIAFSEVRYLTKAVADLFDQEDVDVDKVLIRLAAEGRVPAASVPESVTLAPERAPGVPECVTLHTSGTVRENSLRGSSVPESGTLPRSVTESGTDWHKPGAFIEAYQKAVRLDAETNAGAGSKALSEPSVTDSGTAKVSVPFSGTPPSNVTMLHCNIGKDLNQCNNVTSNILHRSVPDSGTAEKPQFFDEELFHAVRTLQGQDWDQNYRFKWAKAVRLNPDLVREAVSTTRYLLQTPRAEPIKNVATFMNGILKKLSHMSAFLGGMFL